MSLRRLGCALLAGACLFGIRSTGLAQSVAPQNSLPEIVVTPDRIAEPISQTGSTVSVVDIAEIDKTGPKGIVYALQGVPGVIIHETGGDGSATTVTIRGSNPGETLVLIDGVRVGDPTQTDGSLDFGNLSVTDIERVEVLRGPQSALYGSDAMGGVINIITRKGKRPIHRSVTIQAGSYGTISALGAMSGADDRWSYAFSIEALHSDGFPRYGYRINRPLVIGDGVTPLPPLPADDPTNKGGATGRVSYKISDDVTVETGFAAYGNMIRFDNANALIPSDVFSHYNHSTAAIFDAYTRIIADTFGGALQNQLTVFGNVTDRNIWEAEGCFDAFFLAFNCRSGYSGTRLGAEYQGDLKLGPYGELIFGARTETETAATTEDPNPNDGSFFPINAQQTTNSVFALDKVSLGSRFDITLGGRIDAVEGGQTFPTWRTTAAYRIDETGTKFHASLGTGAKVATLYQRYSQYGDPSLAPEQSVGFDVGVDQKLFNDRLAGAITAFDNRYRNLIDFGFAPSCSPTQLSQFGCYFNVGQAETKGIEVAAEAILVPDEWRARANYTFMIARDLTTDATLLQRPTNFATVSLIYSGIPNLEVEARVTMVSSRYDFATVGSVTLAPYAKLDLFANYKVSDNLSIFGRIQNVTDARYEEVYNYGVAARSYYAGIKYDW
ncbi:MAG TPA: TonB-dependent receptor [Roseiarcus sp.]|nr:TonB-dependent receptor [Roseiarcus sp.]